VIEKSVLLACEPERAFTLFTERASDWWPAPLRHTDDARSEIRMLAGGRFWERASDGREVELGRVTAWEPPQRLILDFYPGTDPEHPTEVIVRFADEAGGTRIIVVHGPKSESADRWQDGAPHFAQAWDLVLAALANQSFR
jgi:uncharacterized protein YndB with AHSA1/START domain